MTAAAHKVVSSPEMQPLLNGPNEAVKPKDLESNSTIARNAGNFLGLSSLGVIIVYYALCSSTMLVINKVAVHNIPAPCFVLAAQLGASAGAVKLGDLAGIMTVDALEWTKVKKFLLVVLGFLGTIFCNIKVLQSSNVETFITFRSSTPLILSLCDWWFLGRALPNMRSWSCLLFLLAGSVGYVMTDTGFALNTYYWLMAWYVCFVFDTVYVKHTVEHVKMTNWGRVYYTNLMALPPLLLALPSLNEQERLSTITWNVQTLLPLILSCLMGLGMSHASYLLRDAASATLFTLVGIICKVLTVIINYFLWDKHATPTGIACLMLCVLAGTFYQQAPKRADANNHS